MRHIIDMIKKLGLNTKGLLFNSFGTTLTINAVNKQLKQACNLHGIKQITSHALMHTHCSYLLANDISIYYISKRLGHKNITVTTEIYSHLLEEKYLEENKKAIEILSAM
ncbi:tyrosine-type recombinase/integrase [Staphylococcus equorum]|uniref:tyrosine-type recombinase/integrase n=2 Tax=Staphylococcus equorum TaxID=246432 RepID=UPI00398B3984